MTPLTFSFVASGFTLRTHRAIARTAPVIWCSSHHAIMRADKTGGVDLDLNHFPAGMITIWTPWGVSLTRLMVQGGRRRHRCDVLRRPVGLEHP